MHATGIVGVLLAAGTSKRFGTAKLHVHLPHGPWAGLSVGAASCRNLASVMSDVVAVVRPGDVALASVLESERARVVVAAQAHEGMASSLAAGVAALPEASGYVVALADMPWIGRATIERVVQALRDGASIAAPVYGGQRGHPVGFSSAHRAELICLRGDDGARSIVAAHRSRLTLIEVDDLGTLRDIDTPEDLGTG